MQQFGTGTFGSGTWGGAFAALSAGTGSMSAGLAKEQFAPTAPGKPTVSNITDTSATLTWAAATDDVGVAGYNLYTATLGTSRINSPYGIVIDSGGNLFVGGLTRVARLTQGGILSNLAGQMANTGGTADGTGSSAFFTSNALSSIDPATGTIYQCDYNAIRKITPDGVVTTFAGVSGTSGSADGTGTAALFKFPIGCAYEPSTGNLYVADSGNYRIRKITSAGVVTTIAGTGVSGTADGTGTAAQLFNPQGMVLDNSGNLWFSDVNTVRKMNLSTLVVTTVAGSSTSGFLDATGSAARFSGARGIAFDGTFANLWIADASNNRVRILNVSSAAVTTAAGQTAANEINGTGASAAMNAPSGIVYDPTNTVFYVTDNLGCTVRKIVPNGTSSVVSTLAGLNAVQTNTDTTLTAGPVLGNVLSTTVTGLSSPQTYYYVVKARDYSGKQGQPSDVAVFTTADYVAPTVPERPVATAATSSTVTIGWYPAYDASGSITYTVYMDGTLLISTGSTSYTATGQVPGATHTFSVIAQDYTGNLSASSPTYTYTHPSTPGTVFGVLAQGRTATTMQVTWIPGSEQFLQEYDIRRDGGVIMRTTGPSFVDAGLAPGSTHIYEVRARDLAGNVGVWSSAAGGTTLAASSPAVLLRAPNPTVQPGAGNGSSYNLGWNGTGTKLAVAGATTPYLWLYNRNGSVLTQLAAPGTIPTGATSVSLSPDGNYLAVGRTGSPYLTWYSITGDTLTALTSPSVVGNVTAAVWSPDSTYLAVTCNGAGAGTATMTIYKRSGTTLTALTQPAAVPASGATGQGIAWSPDSNYLMIGCGSSPVMSIYARSGDLFTRLAQTGTYPSSAPLKAAFSPDGTYLAYVNSSTGATVIMQRTGTGSTAVFDQVQSVMTNAGIKALDWSPDGMTLVVSSTNTPYIESFSRLASHLNVRVATTANVALSGLQTIDGVTLAAGDRVLVRTNTTASQNGIWVAASGAWTRSTDANTSGSLYFSTSGAATTTGNAAVYASEGTANAGRLFVMTSADATPWVPGTNTSVWTANSNTSVVRRMPSPATLPVTGMSNIAYAPAGNTIVESSTTSPYLVEYVYVISLAGTAAGTATMTGDFYKTGPIKNLAGTSAGTGTMSATTVTRQRRLTGSAAGTGSMTASLTRTAGGQTRQLAAAVAGTGTMSARLTRKVALSGASHGASGDAAALTERRILAATANGTGTMSATPTVTKAVQPVPVDNSYAITWYINGATVPPPVTTVKTLAALGAG